MLFNSIKNNYFIIIACSFLLNIVAQEELRSPKYKRALKLPHNIEHEQQKKDNYIFKNQLRKRVYRSQTTTADANQPQKGSLKNLLKKRDDTEKEVFKTSTIEQKIEILKTKCRSITNKIEQSKRLN